MARRWSSQSRVAVRATALAGAVAVVLAACGGGGSGTTKPTSKTNNGAVKPADCGLAEFAKAAKPVTIRFWHTMARNNETWLDATTKAFNASQSDVVVKLVKQPNYQDSLTKYDSGLRSGDLPDLAQLEETTVQHMLDTQSTMPMQDCVDADHYSLGDFMERATAYYSTQGVLRSMPWLISNPILGYNRKAFIKAGLDPDKPPKTLDEVKEYSQKIVQSGAAKHGIALRIEPYIFEFLYAKSGGTYVNNGNGRKARATAASIDTPTGLKIWTWWNDMVKSGLALNTGAEPNNIDHMLAIGNDNAAMAMEASGVLGAVEDVLKSGQYPNVDFASSPLPSLDPNGGVPVGDGALWIPMASSPVKRAAAWQFVKYLSTPRQQASLAASGGYVPTRKSSAQDPELVAKWQARPLFKVGYTQLTSGKLSDANIGSIVGNYQGVRDAVRDGLLKMLTQGLSPAKALASAQAQATAAVKEYNSRVGA